jgi:hypothetical protein
MLTFSLGRNGALRGIPIGDFILVDFSEREPPSSILPGAFQGILVYGQLDSLINWSNIHGLCIVTIDSDDAGKPRNSKPFTILKRIYSDRLPANGPRQAIR